MSVPKSHRKPSIYDPADQAQRLFDYINDIFIKVYSFSPQKANAYLCRPVGLSIEVLEYVVKYIEGYVSLKEEYRHRAYDSLNALDVIIEELIVDNNLLTYYDGRKTRGVTYHELKEISETIEHLMILLH